MRARTSKKGTGRSMGRRMRAMLPKALLALCAAGLLFLIPMGARAAYRGFARLSLFRVNEVEVSGLKHVREQDFIKYMGDPRGRSVFEFDRDAALQKASRHPWIKGSTIRRELPGAVVVEVLERTPAAVCETGTGKFVIDTEGFALARVDGPGWDFLPVVQYPSARGLTLLDEKSAAGLRRALELMRVVKGEPSEGLAGAEFILGDDGSPCIRVQGALVRVGHDGYEDKVRRLTEVERDMRKRGVSPAYIDLRFPGKVVIKEAKVLGQTR